LREDSRSPAPGHLMMSIAGAMVGHVVTFRSCYRRLPITCIT
jgi:hypothetical protein